MHESVTTKQRKGPRPRTPAVTAQLPTTQPPHLNLDDPDLARLAVLCRQAAEGVAVRRRGEGAEDADGRRRAVGARLLQQVLIVV